jgi:hypothetical protein
MRINAHGRPAVRCFGLACITAGVILGITITAAAAKCRFKSDPVANCEEAISDWWGGNANHQTPSPGDVEHRTETLRNTLEDCTSCGMDKVESGFNKAAPPTSTDTETSSDSGH